MLDPNNTDRQESQDQKQLSICNRTTHKEKYPFLTEFSELISKMSIEELLELTTHQQKMFAKAIWEAENYGGSRTKCEKRLKEIYGPKWNQLTTIKEHMADINDYYRFVIRLDHKKQWDDHHFWVKIPKDKVLS